MKLERLHEYILPTVVTLCGMGFAAYCGKLTGNGQMSTLLLIFVVLLIGVLALTMRTAIWMAIPVFWGLYGQIPSLPLPFAVRDIVVMSVFGVFLIFKAIKLVRRKPNYQLLDLWMLAVLIYLASVFIRNPVGVDALGSERVGGRPYFVVFVATLAYWVMCRVSVTPLQAKILPVVIAAGHMIEGVLSFITYNFPKTVPFLAPFYSTITPETYNQDDIRRGPLGETTGRQAYLIFIGYPAAQALIAYLRPLTLVNPLYLVRFLMFSAVMLCILFAGFRSALMGVAAMIVINSYLRRGFQDVFRMVVFGIPTLGLILMMQGIFFNLPLPAQRALSFLPGRWDEFAVREAQASTQWRVEMWKTVLSTDKYIESKWFGDGFGFTRRQLEIMQHASEWGGSTEEQQENAMVTGGVHSGPISAIRYVGVVGLAMFVVLLVLIARESVRLCRRAKGTDYFILALFVAVPLIWEPLNFVFIFGGYEGALPDMIIAIGMLKMLGNTLEDYHGNESVRGQLAAGRAPEPKRRVALEPVGAARRIPGVA